MAETETQRIAQMKQEDPLPLLSLKSNNDEKTQKADSTESEKLWKRSLDYFEQMKTVTTH